MKVESSGVCALVSGGLDSCVMLAALARRFAVVHPLYVRQGLVWEETELRYLRRFLRAMSGPLPRTSDLGPPRERDVVPQRGTHVRTSALGSRTSAHRSRVTKDQSPVTQLTVLELPAGDLYGDHWSRTGRGVPSAASPDAAVYLPGRNLLLLSKAAVFCAQSGIGAIAVGSLGHNPFPDATPRFFRQFAAVAGQALGCRLRILAPFRSLTKTEVIRRGAGLGLPLQLSFSCLAPRRGRHCGRCNKCAERQRAFREAGVPDPTEYDR